MLPSRRALGCVVWLRDRRRAHALAELSPGRHVAEALPAKQICGLLELTKASVERAGPKCSQDFGCNPWVSEADHPPTKPNTQQEQCGLRI